MPLMRTHLITAAVVSSILVLTACGTTDEVPEAQPEATVTSTETAPAAVEPTTEEVAAPARDAMEVANALTAEVSTAAAVTEITEDNDANGLIGRPGGYTSAAWIHHETLPFAEGTEGGATVEVFASAEEATNRSEYILGLLKESPMLGSEWHHLDGPVLLRVTGEMKPSDAQVYEAAFKK